MVVLAALAAAIVVVSQGARAGPSLVSNVFGSNMILQRDRPAPIWGWVAVDSTVDGATVHQVTVTLTGTPAVTAITNADGFWRAVLPAQPANAEGRSIQVHVVDGSVSDVLLTNVVFGEVLFCSGQSNMEFTVNSAVNATEEIAAANGFPDIRLFSGPEQNVDTLNFDGVFNVTHDELFYTRLNWSIATNQSVGCVDGSCKGWDYFSAACWFAVRDLYIELDRKVPVGGVSQNYGGTSIQYWMSQDALEASNAPVATQCCGQNGGPACLWNTQVYPYTIGPMQFSAVIFYQGEQNANCGGPTQTANATYSTMLQTMVGDWRVKFKQPLLAFGECLLAAWQSKDLTSFAELRLAQVNLTAYVPKTFLISAIDRGDPDSGAVHSPYKQDVGHRAALGVAAVALNVLTSKYLGPTYQTATATAGNTVQVTFDVSGLYGSPPVVNTSVTCPPRIAPTSCEGFAVLFSPSCTWKIANVMRGTTAESILLTVPNPPAGDTAVATRGYYANWPLVSVTNTIGIPATPWLELINAGAASTECSLKPMSVSILTPLVV
eukprot:m.181611 g.181611  ORF g.181611 m.181611 type:complete len:549 (-) comp24604_c0_seq1:120-1766(-)